MTAAVREVLRAAADTDFPSILRLNAAEVQHTSAMDLGRLEWLVGMSAYCKVVTVDQVVAAFLIAMREGSPYDSDNYRWFASRMDRFLYVDRIVVDAQFAGRGIGSGLYQDLFTYGRTQGVGAITCEYNIDPPNLASRAFHAKFGFREMGTQWVGDGAKQVSLQAASV